MHCSAQVVHVGCLDATKNIGGRGLWFFPKGGSNPPIAHYPTSTGSTRVGAVPVEEARLPNAGPGTSDTGAWQQSICSRGSEPQSLQLA